MSRKERKMGLITFVFALVSIILTLVAFIPLLGWLNWIFIPISIISLILNVIAYHVNTGFKQLARAGIIISIIALVIGIFRLQLFGGIL